VFVIVLKCQVLHFDCLYPPIVASVSPALANEKPVSAETEATEIWYGTADGVVGVTDLQQSSASSQVIPQ